MGEVVECVCGMEAGKWVSEEYMVSEGKEWWREGGEWSGGGW